MPRRRQRREPNQGGGLIHARSPFFASTGLLTYERDRVVSTNVSTNVGTNNGMKNTLYGSATVHYPQSPATTLASSSMTTGAAGSAAAATSAASPSTPRTPTSMVGTINGMPISSSIVSGDSQRMLVRVESSLPPPLMQPQPSSAPRPKCSHHQSTLEEDEEDDHEDDEEEGRRQRGERGEREKEDNERGGGRSGEGSHHAAELSSIARRKKKGRPSIGGATGGLPGSLSGHLKRSSSPISKKKEKKSPHNNNTAAASTLMKMRTPESSTMVSPSLALDQLESTEPEWIQQNKTPMYRSPMYDEYARSSGGGGGHENERDMGSLRMIDGDGGGEKREGKRGEKEKVSSPYVTTGGRSRIVSTAMKQSIWEAEFMAARNRSNLEDHGGGGGRRSMPDPTSPSL